MKRTIPTVAVLMAAILFTAAAAHAQTARGEGAWPPGPTGEATAYPPGPTGQATAQTQNVNVVNAPTVQVGNEVTIKEPARTPLYVQKLLKMLPGADNSGSVSIPSPAGTRMVVETINMMCTSLTVQPVGVYVFHSGQSYGVVTLFPQPLAWNAGSFSSQVEQVHLLVDDSISVSAQRANSTGQTDCAVTLSGYTMPLP